MTNVLTVARRELGHTFRSPLAYVFLILFLVFVQLPFVLSIFAIQQADMRMFFDTLPWLVVIFAALVTMRAWAEERQENTFEMLLTFPMRDWELVLGKFLSAFMVIAVGIVATFSLPLMLLVLGSPDVGAIVTGYVGAFLIAAMWCAAGVFFSGLTRSQLLAALISFVLGMGSLFLGVQAVAVLIDAKAPGVGGVLESVIGTWGHYSALTRGVLEVADVLYFLVWTAVFLYLNTLFVGQRRHPSAGTILTLGTFLAVGCGLLGSRLLSESSIARADLTEDGLYTLSDGTVNILKSAEVPVQATLYVSPRDDMPTDLKGLETEVVGQLAEMRVRSGGMLQYRVVHMEAANAVVSPETDEPDEEEISIGGEEQQSIEQRLIDKGVRPFAVQTVEATEVTNKLIYATLGVTYREKDVELIHPVVPARLPELEYLLANTVARLVRAAPPRIAVHLGEEPLDPQVKQMLQRMGRPVPDPYAGVETLLRNEKYDVVRTKLSAQDPMPADFDALVVVGAELDERQSWEVNRALVSGKPVLLAAQRYTWDYRQGQRGISMARTDASPGVDELLEAQGLGVSTDLLMDANAYTLRVPTGGMMDAFGGTPLKVPTHVKVTPDSMNQDSAITDRLPELLYLWGTPVDLDEERLAKNLLQATTLVSSSRQSWTVPGTAPLRSADLDPEGQELGRRPLVVLVEGTFADAYEGEERPKYPFKLEMTPDGRPLPAAPDPPTGPVTRAPGKLILTGCARMWSDGILGAAGSSDLLLACVGGLTLDEDLLSVRSKTPTPRSFDKPSDTAALFWTLMPLVFVPFGLLGLGLAIGAARMRRRESWNAAHGR